MRRPLLGLSLATALCAPLSCGDAEEPFRCTDMPCDGGVDVWLTSTNVSNVYDEGRYDVQIEFGDNGRDGEFVVTCNVDAAGNGTCDAPDWTTPSVNGMTATVTFGIPPAQQIIMTPAIHIYLVGRSDAEAGENIYGPTEFEVDVSRNNTRKGRQSYSLTWERDEEFNGAPECGFCEGPRQRELLRLDP